MASSMKNIHRATLNSKTLLVCGGAGFIGSNFIKTVLKRYPRVRVINLDALTYAGNPDNLRDVAQNPNYAFIRGDIADAQKVSSVFKKYKPDYVVNFAAETHVDRSIHEGAETFFQTNVLGVLRLLEAVRTFSVKKFIQISTDEVYGSLSLASRARFTENSPLAPNSPYAASKASADMLCRSFFKTHGVPVVVTRCSNNYGPYQSPEKFIPFSISRLLSGRPIALYGDGKNVRDWVHVDDHNTAVLRALLNGTPGETYNIGASEEVSNKKLAEQIIHALGKKPKKTLTFVADRHGHDLRYAIDSSKIRKELQWQPSHSFARSLKDTVRWYELNQIWMKKARKRIGEPNAHISKKR